MLVPTLFMPKKLLLVWAKPSLRLFANWRTEQTGGYEGSPGHYVCSVIAVLFMLSTGDLGTAMSMFFKCAQHLQWNHLPVCPPKLLY